MVEAGPSTTLFALLQPRLLLCRPTPGKPPCSVTFSSITLITAKPFNIVFTHFYQGGVSGWTVRSWGLCKWLHSSHTFPPEVILKCCSSFIFYFSLCRVVILQLTEWLNHRLLLQRPTVMGRQTNTPQRLSCFLWSWHSNQTFSNKHRCATAGCLSLEMIQHVQLVFNENNYPNSAHIQSNAARKCSVLAINERCSPSNRYIQIYDVIFLAFKHNSTRNVARNVSKLE